MAEERVTQTVKEVLYQMPPSNARTTQVVIEVLRSQTSVLAGGNRAIVIG